MTLRRCILLGLSVLIACASPVLGQAQKSTKKAAAKTEGVGPTPEPHPNGKYGGTLRGVLREGWASLSPQEASTISDVWPASPMYNNLVLYEPFRAMEDGQHVVGELAESWAWSDGGKKLTFKLRRGVTWHDGKPFTANDVKFTFDVARGTAEKRFKMNPRKDWWENVADITTNGDYEITFVLKAPQASLMAFLANGYTPIIPAHIDPQEMRLKPVGTGPFMLKESKVEDSLTMVKNPNYFIKGRPYLDGIAYTVVKSRPSRIAAMQANQFDIFFPGDANQSAKEQMAAAAPSLVFDLVARGGGDNILLNHKKPPFDNPKLRRVVNLALDRSTMIKSVHQGVAVAGGANLPPPYGKWGLPKTDLVKLPGYGDPAKDKAEARKILKDLGYNAANPFKVVVSTRALDAYVDTAVWVIAQLKEVGIEATLEQFETGVWHPKLTRREFQIATNLTSVAVDDPDGNFFENYSCGSPRNYSDYCNPKVDEQMQLASKEADPAKRLKLVRAIDIQLQLDVARPFLAHQTNYYAYWPYVKNLVPHHNMYNYGRMQNVWLDK